MGRRDRGRHGPDRYWAHLVSKHQIAGTGRRYYRRIPRAHNHARRLWLCRLHDRLDHRKIMVPENPKAGRPTEVQAHALVANTRHDRTVPAANRRFRMEQGITPKRRLRHRHTTLCRLDLYLASIPRTHPSLRNRHDPITDRSAKPTPLKGV